MSDARTADLPADELVAALHPYGQWTGQHTTAAAAQIAELVRYLNHATIERPSEALPDPNTTAAVLGALHTTCTRLPQLLSQLRARIRAFETDPDLATSSTDVDIPAGTRFTAAEILAARAAQAIARAESVVWQFTTAIGDAHQAVDPLYLDIENDE